MKTGQYPVLFLAAVLLVLALGIELSLAQSFSIRWGGAALAALLLASLLLLWRGNRLCAIMVLLLFFALGIVRLQAALFLPPADISYFAGAGAEVKVSGTIDDEPRWTQAVLPGCRMAAASTRSAISWRWSRSGARAATGRRPQGSAISTRGRPSCRIRSLASAML